MLGQTIHRTESGASPLAETWYRFDGRQVASLGTSTTDTASYAATIDQRGYTSASSRTGSADDLDRSYQAINSYSQGSTQGSYTVRGGDTLAGIAATLWGDAALWYKLAAANGLTADAMLTAGTTLQLPANVVRTSNSASTLRPYDPSEAYGDTSPTTPTPVAKAARNNRCGAFGQILLVAVAVAVTVASQGTLAGIAGSALGVGASTTAATVAGGVLAGAAGSIASQGVGVATGLQQGFDWKGVALAGIAGGIGGALKGVDLVSGLGKATSAVNAGLRASIGSAVTQGVGVATGLQAKFDFAGVAAAGIGAGLANGVGGKFGFGGGSFGDRLATNTASGIANAAVRSIANGTSFGDNLMAALPDVIGNTIGNMIANGVAGDPNSPRRVARRADNQFEPFLSEADRSSTEFQAGRKIARAEFEADIAAARAANDPALLRLARDRYADFYASSSPGFAAELSQARTLSTGPDLSRGAQFIGLDDADTIVVTGVRPPRGVAIFPLVDPLSVEAGNIAINVGSAASAAIDRVPGGRLAVTLVDVGLAIGGGPVRYAVGKAYEAGKDGLIGYATGRFADAHYGRDARAGGVGLPVLGSILTGGVGAGLNTLSVLGGITIRNAHLAGGNHPVTGVPFDSNGFPDFSGHAIHTVSIGQTGRRGVDNRAANRAAGLRREPEGYTWHHHQDGVTMQLVPTSLHGETAHTGGVALRKKP